jgi:molybdopterin synthase sulfur carrier subunit
LRKLTGGNETVTASGATIQEILADLQQQFPGIKERLCDEQGQLRRFINLYLNDEDVRFMQGEQTAVKDGDEISIIPSIAGG